MKICVATGNRAEYGLLKPLVIKIQQEKNWTLQLLVTGAHLSPEFGLTYKQIEEDEFVINEKVEMLLSSDTDEGIVKSMGLGMIGFADALKRLKPNLLVILGDRFEMLALASAAIIFKIPIAHIHGGEITEAAYDDSIRHAITKLSHLHFTSTEDYQKRVIQLGENPETVFNVGAIGLDNIFELQLLSKVELEQKLKIHFLKYNYQITFHPVTLANEASENQFRQLLNSIKKQQDSFFVFTKANADSDGRIINQMIDEFVSENSNCASFSSLGTLIFLSLLKFCDAIVGNSSSGIIEAPSLGTPTINIGNRQKGRAKAKSVIDCGTSSEEICKSFEIIKSRDYITLEDKFKNPYGKGNVASKIIEAIKASDFENKIVKKFYNLNK